MRLKKGQEFEATIEDLAFGGKGVCRVDGMVVFVEQSAPLDHVRAQVFRKKRNYAEARIREILSPSPYRTTPPCPYSGFCGGCKLQFLQYDQQLEYKRKQVVDAIERIGLASSVPVHASIPSDTVFGYRNKMEFSCSNRRWVLPEEMGDDRIDRSFALGLHVPGTFDKVLDTKSCLLQPQEGNDILCAVRRFMIHSRRTAYGLRSHEGFWRFLMLRHSRSMNHWMVNVITSEEDRQAVDPLVSFLSDVPAEIVSVVNNITDSKAAVAIGQRELQLAGSPVIQETIGHLRFDISANSFFQTNSAGAERLYAVVRDYAGLSGGESVLDLYCGTGTISLYLSDAAGQITGMEMVSSAVLDAERNCRINEIENCRFIAGDVRTTLGQVEEPPDVMVIDPPRAGMHKDVLKQVLDLGPRRIVYVSCNPATLARDIKTLKEVYDIAEIQPVDMFPHTFHIEAVAKLDKKITA